MVSKLKCAVEGMYVEAIQSGVKEDVSVVGLGPQQSQASLGISAVKPGVAL